MLILKSKYWTSYIWDNDNAKNDDHQALSKLKSFFVCISFLLKFLRKINLKEKNSTKTIVIVISKENTMPYELAISNIKLWGCVGSLLKLGFLKLKIKGNEEAPHPNNGLSKIIGTVFKYM